MLLTPSDTLYLQEAHPSNPSFYTVSCGRISYMNLSQLMSIHLLEVIFGIILLGEFPKLQFVQVNNQTLLWSYVLLLLNYSICKRVFR